MQRTARGASNFNYLHLTIEINVTTAVLTNIK